MVILLAIIGCANDGAPNEEVCPPEASGDYTEGEFQAGLGYGLLETAESVVLEGETLTVVFADGSSATWRMVVEE